MAIEAKLKQEKRPAFNLVTVNSLSEFVIQLETRINDRYRITLFRGQNVDKALIPTIARSHFKKSREKDERHMFEDFSTNSIPLLKHQPNNQLERLTIAQHHRLPTRLLDWTENALTALYFATEAAPPASEEGAVVWVISLERGSDLLVNDSNFNPFNCKELKFYKPNNIIQRVSSQMGWFSIHPYLGQGMYERAETVKDPTFRINKIFIPREKIKGIQQTLASCGINEYTIFQDLDSLGKFIHKKYRSETNAD